ncbi:hypothetical protein ENUP19_0357G0010 [Entamoeba nuttalli]|uniref:Chorein N-terminal domain-containing protein n=2 Tax=Entamoeba nuttalli TaxID=412467 RepID=K2H4G5_ENTNP|nr:hypothetical protein ENU1_020940 [Entamoeba nuttalli P19]EKE42448.1 hypothetical protein ENU1_020940 [Entamoeba nuttalli P19]|eukprot:XP_008855215.1 hypothetical protein ENU1_020940 [Entamoeba nuttalli P19]
MPSVQDFIKAIHLLSLSHEESEIYDNQVIIKHIIIDPKCISRYFQYPRTITIDRFEIPEMKINVPKQVDEKCPFEIEIKEINYFLSLKTHEEYEISNEKIEYLLPYLQFRINQINCKITIGNAILKMKMNDINTETNNDILNIFFNKFSIIIENDNISEEFIKDIKIQLNMSFKRDQNGHVICVDQKWIAEEICIICTGETYKNIANCIRKIITSIFSSQTIEHHNQSSSICLDINKLNIILKDLLDGDIHINIGKIIFEMDKIKYNEELCMYFGKTIFSVGEFEVQYILKEEINKIVWTIKEGNAIQLNVTKGIAKEGIEAKGIIGIDVDLKCNGLGITMDFKLLSKMIDLLKITMQKNLTKINVNTNQLEILKEKTEKKKELFSSKYERLLQYFQLKSIIDLLGKVYFSFELNNSLFTVKFQSNSIFTITLGNLKLNNKPIKHNLTTLEICNEKLKKEYKATEVKEPVSLDISILIKNVEAFGMVNDKKDRVFYGDVFEVQFNLIFDKENNKGIPSIIYCYGKSDDLEITLSHQMFLDIYNYIKDFINGFQETEKDRLKDISKQIGTTVTENANKITDKSIEFVNKELKNIQFPTIAVLLSFGKGKVVVPISSIVYRNKEHDCSKLTEIVRSELDIMFVSNESGRTFGIIIDEIGTGSVENILEPLESISKKKMEKGFLFQQLPQTTPSLILTLNHISSKIKTTKNISMDIKLYGVQVKLKKLGVFGKDTFKQVSEGKPKDENLNNEDKKEDTELKPENDEELNVKLKVIDFFKEKYHGFEFSVQMSECDVIAEDELHTINITTSNKYVQSGEDICVDLNRKIELEKAQQDGLEMEVAQLKVRLANLKQQQDIEESHINTQPKKSRLAFWKK